MTEINPLATTILGSIQQQRMLGIEKSRQLRRSKVLEKNIAAEGEAMENEVDNSEEVKAVNDEGRQQQKRSKQDNPEEPKEEKTHIDIRG